MPKYIQRYPTRFKKRLVDLTPPVLRTATPHDRFTADLQLLNHFFWSTELATATFLSDYHKYEDRTEPSHVVLAGVAAHALKPKQNSKVPHYRANIGSLLVQLRWNYDALGRYVLIDSVSICEQYIKARVEPLLGTKCPGSFAGLFERLRRLDIVLDPITAFRAQLYKLLRNHIVHARSTIHSFPSRDTVSAVNGFRARAASWNADAEWLEQLAAACNEMLVTTKMASKSYDVPQLFVASIFALTRIREFGDDIELKCRRVKQSDSDS